MGQSASVRITRMVIRSCSDYRYCSLETCRRPIQTIGVPLICSRVLPEFSAVNHPQFASA